MRYATFSTDCYRPDRTRAGWGWLSQFFRLVKLFFYRLIFAIAFRLGLRRGSDSFYYKTYTWACDRAYRTLRTIERIEVLKSLPTTFQDAPKASALHLVATRKKGFSRFGGIPSLPPSFEWPMRDGQPLQFMAQIDLATAAAIWNTGGDTAQNQISEDTLDFSELPFIGGLYFFYDIKLHHDKKEFGPMTPDGWKVVYVEDLTRVTPRQPPGPCPEETIGQVKESYIELRRIAVYPPSEWQEKRYQQMYKEMADMDAYQFNALMDEPFNSAPKHQLLGYADPDQHADMDLESQLASNGLYCSDSGEIGFDDPRAVDLEAGAKEWKLLFQIDSSDSGRCTWGDMGKVYFWIRRGDLAKRDFDKVWAILQCG